MKHFSQAAKTYDDGGIADKASQKGWGLVVVSTTLSDRDNWHVRSVRRRGRGSVRTISMRKGADLYVSQGNTLGVTRLAAVIHTLLKLG